MSVPIHPIPSFKSIGSIRGIPYGTLFVAAALTMPFALYFNVILKGLIWLMATGFVMFIMIRVAEVLTQVIPAGYVTHLLDWLRAGQNMYATHDAKPVPLVVDITADYRTGERDRRKKSRQRK